MKRAYIRRPYKVERRRIPTRRLTESVGKSVSHKNIDTGTQNSIKVLRTWLTRTEVKNSIFTSIIAAITAALLISGINVLYDFFKEKHDVINAIQNILIGSNKEWIDSELGPSNFSSIQGNFVECVYILDTTAVTVFYDIGTNSCRGYFVTILKKDILFPINTNH